MNIASRIRLLIALPLLLVVLIGLGQFWSMRHLDYLERYDELGNELEHASIAFDHLVTEFSWHPKERRAQQQLENKFEEITSILNQVESELSGTESILVETRSALAELKRLYEELQQEMNVSTSTHAIDNQERKQWLLERVLLTSRDLVLKARRLEALSQEKIDKYHELTQLVVPLFITAVAILVIALGQAIGRKILRSLLHLKEGVSGFSATTLDYRLNWKEQNEIGDIAAVFDVMAQRLEKEVQALKLLEKEARQNEERFRAVFHNASLGMAISRVDTGIEETNIAMEKMLGYSSEEFISLGWESLTHPDDVAQNRDALKAVSRGEIDNFHLEKRCIHKKGQVIWASLTVSTVRDEEGRCLYLISILEDISDRKRLEKRNAYDDRRKELLLQIGARRLDTLEDNISAVVEGAAQLTGSTAACLSVLDSESNQFRVLGRSHGLHGDCLNCINGKHSDSCNPLHMVISKNAPVWINECGNSLQEQRCPDMIQRFVSIPLLHEGKAIAVLMVANKLSDYEAIDAEQLEHYLEGAWRIIQHRMDEEKIIAARKDAERANKAKSEFLANMSHEIRTPMNAIIGMGQLLADSTLNPRQKDQTRKIVGAANSLLGIIDDILDFSKIEAGRMELENVSFNLSELLDRVSGIISLKAEEQGIELLFDIPADLPQRLIGDPLRLQQVLVNLGGNAVKFTHEGEVILGVKVIDRGDDQCRLGFWVQDTGIGLTEEQRLELFQPFHQADTSTTRHFGGTGLGLVISRFLVEQMGGGIHVDSSHGEGSTFSFEVQLGMEPNADSGYMVPPTALAGVRVLVVDDNPSARKIFNDMVQSLSFDGTAVSSGDEALEELDRAVKAGEKVYDLILLDWRMPEMDGLETARRIKDDPLLPKPPLIIMATAFGHKEVMEGAKEIGIEGFLLKPVTTSVLFNAIMEVFGHGYLVETEASSFQLAKKDQVAALQGVRVLVVEDNDLNWEVAQGILAKAGVLASRAGNGKEALELCGDDPNEVPFDVVLMDLQMPVMDGYEATQQLRRMFTPKQLPIIAMTAHALKHEQQRCMELGMNDYLTKPVHSDQLFIKLMTWISPSADRLFGGSAASEDSSVAPLEKSIALTSLPEALPGIAIGEALARLRGDVELVTVMIVGFYKHYKNAKEVFASLLQNEDLNDARIYIHSLKGAAGNLGAKALYEVAGKIELMLQQNDTDDLTKLVGVFEKELDTVIESAQSITPSMDTKIPATTTTMGYAALITACEAFKHQLQSGDLKAKESFLIIEPHLKDYDVDQAVEQLANDLDNLDFDSGIEQLMKILAVVEQRK